MSFGSLLLCAVACFASIGGASAHAIAPTTDFEARTNAIMRSFGDDRAKLRLLLEQMPKGGDLHNHLDGAIYAEDLLGWAAASGLCITTDKIAIVRPPCDKTRAVPAASLIDHYDLYSRAIDALSTRGFEHGQGDPTVSGADRFFATFDDFEAAVQGNVGKAIAIAREQAAADQVDYLELQIGALPLAGVLAKDWAAGLSPTDFAAMLARLQPILPEAVTAGRADLDSDESGASSLQRCGTAAATPSCAVTVRYLMSAMRTYAPSNVFAELAYGFALVHRDPRVVGVNIVAPEHDPVAVRDYRLHMAMIAFLKQHFPDVPLSLHAGELTLGMVPPRDLRFHIHDAVAVAGARRIGHGVDIAYEDGAPALLQRMAHDRVAVEINLTSNAVILGVRGKEHPLALYRAAGVPVVLSTDDEGVSRTDMTNEYVRAVTEQGLDYHALKRMARDSIEYAFVSGKRLWNDGAGGRRTAPCAASLDSPACLAFAGQNAKADLQRTLEIEFRTFEQAFVPSVQRLLSTAKES